MRREREKEKGRFDGAHRECACILILEPSLPQINVFASNTFLLRFILQPCRGVSLSFSFSLSLSLSLSLSSSRLHLDPFPFCFRVRLLMIIIIHSTLARGAAKVTILLLATSPYARYVRVSRGICNRLFLSFALPVLSTICLGVLYPRDFQLILNIFLIGVLCYNLHNRLVSLISYAISKFICI